MALDDTTRLDDASSPCTWVSDSAAPDTTFTDMGSSCTPAQQCPICLNPITGDAFLDPCFHSFCFHCILQWADMVFTHPSMVGETYLECPLCKTPSSCIIHNVVLDTFQRHYLSGVPPSKAPPFLLSQAHYLRLYVYKNHLQPVIAETLNQNVGCKRRSLHISGNKNVQEWLQRELQALMQEEDVELVMQHVLGILEHFERKQKVNSHAPVLWTHAMVDAAKPFLFENAETFCKELQNFMLSGLNVKAYDLLVEEALRAHTLQVLKA